MIKKLTTLLLILSVSVTLNAQVKTPQPSPSSKIEQTVGLTTVTLEYSRPGVRGRTIFGDLVPYGKVWRTGANANTKITFSDPITVDGQTLNAGTYAIYTIPNEGSWEIIFYSDATNWGTPQEWDESKVAAKTTVKTHEVPFNVESFTFDINNLQANGATLEIIWENTYLAMPFAVPTDVAVMASIESTMKGEPKPGDYFSAAVYYLNEDKDLNQAKEWIDKAVETREKPAFWVIRQQSLIYAALGDTDGAITVAKKSLALAEEAGNADYIKMNTESIAEWSK